MRCGVWLFPAAPAGELVAAAAQAEAEGLDQFWLGDEGPAREPFAVLAAAAGATKRITLAIGITNPYIRPPALSATTALTIAELAGGPGRIILALGAGGTLALEPFGIPAPHPLASVRQAIETIRKVCAGEAGVGYQPVEHAMHGHLPLYVGARGERLNRLASAEADGAFVAGLPPFHYEQVLSWCRSVRSIEIALYPSVAFTAEDVERSRPQMLWALANAPLAVQQALDVQPAQLAEATAALTAGEEKPAATLMTDDRLSQVMLIGEPAVVGKRLAGLVRHHRPTAIGLALLQRDLTQAIDSAAATFRAMHQEL